MYMRPTLPASGLACVTIACNQLIDVLSRHIGSGPGVAGLSGMHVKPLVPARMSLRIMRSHAGVPQGWCLAMCLILLAWRVHPNFPCVVAANRDEYFARPTASADWWPGDSPILGGRDLQAGGTWLGVTRSG